MNRSGAQKHSTLVGEEILGDIHREEEEEKEGGGKREEGSSAEIVENAEAEAEGKKESQGEAGWQDIEESILATFLFDEAERIEMQQVKKRKGDSLEINEKFKKEKLEESKKYSEETDKERVQRKIREMLDILNTDGSIEQERIRMKKLLGEINTIQNKTSHIQVSKGEEEEIKCEQCQLKVEQDRQRKETEKIIGILKKGETQTPLAKSTKRNGKKRSLKKRSGNKVDYRKRWKRKNA
ncbi:zinc finger protein 830-like [Diabrotica virgifera virgifera]|uniref:Uncharacterized protein n=1 Tax=Diabrotica virgifera virgifera TaxID=50390 RepID=A0ABM5L194_DIAVI|nr:zinc finger protein 830-like [Diabrotica virgifera virgifera]